MIHPVSGINAASLRTIIDLLYLSAYRLVFIDDEYVLVIL